jgi:hypothetical protein
LWVAQTEGAKFWLQVLTELQNRGVEGHLHRLRGWAERVSGSDRGGISARRSSVMYRASGAGLAQLCGLESTQAGGGRPAVDLPCGPRRRRPSNISRNWRRSGKPIPASARCSGGTGRAARRFSTTRRISARRSTPVTAWSRGVAESVAAQDHQNPRRIPQRRGGAQVVSGPATGGEEVDHADPSLARSPQPLHDSVAGTDAGPREDYAMNGHPASTGMGTGTAPFPCTSSPKTKPGRLHKSLDTPLRSRCRAARAPRSLGGSPHFD